MQADRDVLTQVISPHFDMASTTVFDMEPPSGNQPNPRAPRPLFRAATKEEEAGEIFYSGLLFRIVTPVCAIMG